MANELELKYGCNPNQKPARIFMKEGELPIEVLNGRPGYINLLDAFNSWQLVKEQKTNPLNAPAGFAAPQSDAATDQPAAAPAAKDSAAN